MLIASKDASQDWLSVERHLRQFVGGFVESSGNAIEFEAIELVL
jgi:hypothetical protein